jgi:hypothetical protein
MSPRVYHSALLALVLGCAAPEPAVPASPPAQCDRSMVWGGWAGSPECAAAARTVIPAADLSCARDQDCALVGRSSCGANAVARRAEPAYANHAPACGHPAAAECPALEFVAECRGGCCSVGLAPER